MGPKKNVGGFGVVLFVGLLLEMKRIFQTESLSPNSFIGFDVGEVLDRNEPARNRFT